MCFEREREREREGGGRERERERERGGERERERERGGEREREGGGGERERETIWKSPHAWVTQAVFISLHSSVKMSALTDRRGLIGTEPGR